MTRAVPLVVLSLCGGATLASAQTVHRVTMQEGPGRGEYRFSPSVVTVRPGDVLVFRAASGAPHSVVFEAGGLSAVSREALNSALPNRSADLSSPLLTREGAEYRIVVPELPAGSYPFFCLPHRAYDMRGELQVKR